MEKIIKNKGVIIFYILLIVITLAVTESNKRELIMENRCVYLTR